MIQRIQTVWLSIATIFSLLLLNGEFLRFAGQNQEIYTVSLWGLYKITGSSFELLSRSLFLSIGTISLPVALLVAIFLFKKRSLQKLAVILVICISVFLCMDGSYYWYILNERYNAVIVPVFKMLVPVIVIILAMLAYAGINKDDKLVRSYDRLR